jgi:hypothetical protein
VPLAAVHPRVRQVGEGFDDRDRGHERKPAWRRDAPGSALRSSPLRSVHYVLMRSPWTIATPVSQLHLDVIALRPPPPDNQVNVRQSGFVFRRQRPCPRGSPNTTRCTRGQPVGRSSPVPGRLWKS